MPPPALVLFAVLAVQIGAGVATYLFPMVGADGAVALRLIFSASMLWLFRGKWSDVGWLRQAARQWHWLLIYGLCIAAMNYCFFKAIERIPLGVAVAIEFSGPLAVSAVMSRQLKHLCWVVLAATGILLLTPLSGAELDPVGILYALASGLGWGTFGLLSKRISDGLRGNDGLLIGMTIAALLMLPVLATVELDKLLNPTVLLIGLCVGLLSTAIPFTLEFEALKRLSSASYGILVSTEPAVAAVVGAVLLGEHIGTRGFVAVVCVVVAAVGVSYADVRSRRHKKLKVPPV